MQNAIVTHDLIIPFEKIKILVSDDKSNSNYKIYLENDCYVCNITEEQRQDYINWLENKDNTPISIEQNKINEFHKNRCVHVSEINLDDYDNNSVKDKELEQHISVMDFIKHMIDNYEVEIKIKKENLYIGVREDYDYIINFNQSYEIDRIKFIMNNEDGYFKERER